MIKKLAQHILKDELTYKERVKREAEDRLESYIRENAIIREKNDALQAVLDNYKECFTFGVGIETSKDLGFTPEQKQWLKEQGDLSILPTILDKLLVNVITGLAKRPSPATQEEVQRIQSIRLAYLMLMSEALEAAGKKVTVDPLTTEVKEQK